MLVLGRTENETIEIPSHGITIRVVAIGRGKVAIGIEADRDVVVLRGSCWTSRERRR